MSNVRCTCTDVDGTAYALVVRDDPVVRLFVCEESGDPKLCMGVLFMDPQDLEDPLPMVEWADGNILIRPQVVTWFMEDGDRILKELVEGVRSKGL